MTTPRARRTSVPDSAHATGKVADPHYASAFELPTGAATSRSPEQWLRATFETAPTPVSLFVRAGWRFVLGLRLAPMSSSEHVLGWTVTDTDTRSAAIQAHSRLLGSQNTVVVGDGKVAWVTFVRFTRPLARMVWAAAAPIHHRTIPYLLRRAARRMS